MSKLLVTHTLLGALLGGFPGAVLALHLGAVLGSETAWCLATVALSVTGAYTGMLTAQSPPGSGRIRLAQAVLPAVLGVLWGGLGYVLLAWTLRYAVPL